MIKNQDILINIVCLIYQLHFKNLIKLKYYLYSHT